MHDHAGATRITGPDACSRILLVGEVNPYGADPRYALYYEPAASAGGRLQRVIFGVSARRWYLPMWRVNLCEGSWDTDEAISRAGAVLGFDTIPPPWGVVVALGVRVNTALRQRAARALPVVTSWPEPFESAALAMAAHQTIVVNLPHPSGRNAANWTAGHIQRTRDLMRRVAPDVPWGDRDA